MRTYLQEALRCWNLEISAMRDTGPGVRKSRSVTSTYQITVRWRYFVLRTIPNFRSLREALVPLTQPQTGETFPSPCSSLRGWVQHTTSALLGRETLDKAIFCSSCVILKCRQKDKRYLKVQFNTLGFIIFLYHQGKSWYEHKKVFVLSKLSLELLPLASVFSVKNRFYNFRLKN